MAKKTKIKLLKARVTHLEMTTQSVAAIAIPTRPPIALLHAKNMPVHFYRYLYEQIGKEHHWYERRVLSDDAILEIIHAPTTHLHVLYVNGCPAGFFELSNENAPESVEIVYFGLLPEYQGMGLGKWFLHNAIQNGWQLGGQKLTVHTNTLDHPAALTLYQKMGFSPVSISEEEVTVWE